MDISFERLLSLFISKLKYIILITIVVSIGAFWISNNFIDKKYTSKTALMIQINQQSGQSINSELTVTKQSVENYVRMLYTDNFFRKAVEIVNEELGTDFTHKQLKKSSSIASTSVQNTTSDFIISFVSGSPETASSVLSIIAREAIVYLNEDMKVSNPAVIIENASIPSAPSSPNVKTNTLYAFIVSALVSSCFFFFIEIFDDRVKNVKDITQAYNLPILGVIPDYVPTSEKKKKSKPRAKSTKEGNKNE